MIRSIRSRLSRLERAIEQQPAGPRAVWVWDEPPTDDPTPEEFTVLPLVEKSRVLRAALNRQGHWSSAR